MHQRFFRSTGMGYAINMGEGFSDVRIFDDLPQLVEASKEELGLVTPCPNGSVFADVFNDVGRPPAGPRYITIQHS